MKKFNIIILNICLILLLNLSAFSQNLPDIKARVTDQTGTLSPSEVQTLEEKLKIFEQEKGSQVIVVIISSTEDYTIEEYTIKLAEKAKIGREGVDDGVIMLFAMADRKMRIEVGYGLEGTITDAFAKRIINNVIVPEFRAGHFYKGIDNGVNIILDLIKGEELPPALANDSYDNLDNGGIYIFFGVFFTFFIRMFFQKSLGKVGSFFIVSAVIFLIIWIITNLEIAIVYEVFLMFIYLISRGKSSGGAYGGGSFGSGGGFSSGGGGFSGGGGSFGGGGSSGSW